MNTSTLNIAIKVDDKGSIKIEKLGKTAKTAGEKGEKSFKGFRGQVNKLKGDSNLAISSLGRMAGMTFAAGIAGLAALTVGMVSTLGAASDLNEAQGKFDVVFDGQQGKAEAWATELVDAYAMSRREALDTLSGLQDMLVPMGLVPEAAGEMSLSISKLSSDLGSFNNVPTAQVVGDIKSALVGSYEPMMKYGAVLTAATVAEKAMTMGLVKTKDELTAAHKAQAAYQLIVEASSAAIGDMARTGDGYANQLKSFHAITEDLTAAMGSRLLPVAADVLGKINAGMRDGEGGVGSLAEAISVKLLQALGLAVETMRFFHNGWLGIKLVGTVAIDAIAVSLKTLYGGLRLVMKPLDKLAEFAVWAGAIDVNPFDGIENALGTFATSSRDVTKQVMADIEKTNSGYDNIKTTIKGYIKSVQDVAPAAKTSAEIQIKAQKNTTDATVRNIAHTKKELSSFAREGKKLGVDMWLAHAEASDEARMRGIQALHDVEEAASTSFSAIDSALDDFFSDLDATSAATTSTMTVHWQTFTDDASNSFTTSLSNVVKGEFDTIGDAWDSLWEGMLNKLADIAAEMAVTWAASQVSNYFQGWKFHEGTWNLKDDEVPAVLQMGEMVIPAEHAGQIRDNMMGMGNGGSGSFEGLVEATSLSTPAGWEDDFSNHFGDLYSMDLAGAIGSIAMSGNPLSGLLGYLSPMNAISNINTAMGMASMDALGFTGKWSSGGYMVGSALTAWALSQMGPLAAMLGLTDMGGVLGGFIGDSIGDAFDLREFENVRDTLEEMGVSRSEIGTRVDNLGSLQEMFGSMIDSKMSIEEANMTLAGIVGPESNLGLNAVLAEQQAAWAAAKTERDKAFKEEYEDTFGEAFGNYGITPGTQVGGWGNYGSEGNSHSGLDDGGFDSGGWDDPGEGWFSTGGVVNRLMVPRGEDGWAALKYGEGIVDDGTMDILSASIKNGNFNDTPRQRSGSDVVAEIRALRKDLEAANFAIADNTRKMKDIFIKWDGIGMPPEVIA